MRLKQKKNKKQRPTEHPDDADRLIMDAIYNSRSPEVKLYYRQVVQEENLLAKSQIEREETWNVDAYLDRVHMRMGARFFDLLPPVMQQRFRAEYPTAFLFASNMNGSDKQLATVA